MTRRLYPARLTGTVAAPPSKSAWHRELICRFLAGQPLPQELHPPQEPQPPAEASLSPVISSRRPSRKLSTASSASPVTPEMSSMWAFSTALRAYPPERHRKFSRAGKVPPCAEPPPGLRKRWFRGRMFRLHRVQCGYRCARWRVRERIRRQRRFPGNGVLPFPPR